MRTVRDFDTVNDLTCHRGDREEGFDSDGFDRGLREGFMGFPPFGRKKDVSFEFSGDCEVLTRENVSEHIIFTRAILKDKSIACEELHPADLSCVQRPFLSKILQGFMVCQDLKFISVPQSFQFWSPFLESSYDR